MNTKELYKLMIDQTLMAIRSDLQTALDAEMESEERYDELTAAIVEVRQELSDRGYSVGLLPSVVN